MIDDHRSISDSLIYFPIAHDVWKEFNHLYAQIYGVLIYQIQHELYSLSQGSDDVSTYFTKVSKIWDELCIVLNFPDCTCNVATGISKFLDDQRLIELLIGLNDTYKTFRVHSFSITHYGDIQIHDTIILK